MIEFFEHTADVGFRVHALSRVELYQDAARALFGVILENLDDVHPRDHRCVSVSGNDDLYLLFDWLTELLFLHSAERLVFNWFHVEFTSVGLVATVIGEKIDLQRHRLLHEVKAVTYHQLAVESASDGWTATVILDV